MNTVMVIFSVGETREDFFDDQLRGAALANGLKALSEIDGLRLLTSMQFACTATFSGSQQALEALDALVRERNLGTVEWDASKPIFRPAMGQS